MRISGIGVQPADTALPGYYTTAEAAKVLGYADSTRLKKLCASAEIIAYKVGNVWLIPANWVLVQQKKPPIGKGNRGVKRK